MRTGVVGGGKRADDEFPAPDRPDAAADVFNDAAVLVAHRGRFADGVQTAIGPEIRPADTRRRQADDRVRRFNNSWVRPIVNAHVARTVKHCTSHNSLPSFAGLGQPSIAYPD